MPPSTTRFCPETNEDASEARKSNGPSSSLKSPHRPAGVRVSSHAVPCEHRLDRSDVHDLPRAARNEGRRQRPRHRELAGDVRADELVPVGHRELGERRTTLHAGVVDQDVRHTVVGDERLDAACDGVGVCHVERDRSRRLTGDPARLVAGALDDLGVPAVHDDPRSRARQCPCQRASEAAGGAVTSASRPSRVNRSVIGCSSGRGRSVRFAPCGPGHRAARAPRRPPRAHSPSSAVRTHARRRRGVRAPRPASRAGRAA